MSLSVPQRETLENATAYYQASVLEAKDYLLARGITGEIAEAEAVRLLRVELAPVRSPGYDVIRRLADGTHQRLQVKGRVLPTPRFAGRMGALDVEQAWDGVLLVLMNTSFNAIAIFEADRAAVITALQRPGSKARNERGALAVPQFCSGGGGYQRTDSVNARAFLEDFVTLP